MFEDVFHDDDECNDSDMAIANKEWEKMTNDCEKVYFITFYLSHFYLYLI